MEEQHPLVFYRLTFIQSGVVTTAGSATFFSMGFIGSQQLFLNRVNGFNGYSIIFQGVKKMNNKVFSERFNRELAISGFPEDVTDKTKAVCKVFGVNSHLAHAMIFGHLLPSQEQLNRIADVLEVCPKWLCGLTERKKASVTREEAEVA